MGRPQRQCCVRLLDGGAEIDHGRNASALGAGCAMGHTDIVQLLLERRADEQRTFTASGRGHAGMIELLVELGGYDALDVPTSWPRRGDRER